MCIRDRNQGRLDDALLFYRRALRSLEQIGGSLYVVGAINLNLGATHVRRGETTVAFEHLERARELFSRAKAGDLLPEMHRRLAEAHLLQGATADARREAETSLATAEELSMMVEQGLSRRLLGVIAAEEARVDEAERQLQEAIQILTDIGDDYGLACAQLSLAELCSHRRDSERRAQLLAECIPVFERLGAALELGRAQTLQLIA